MKIPKIRSILAFASMVSLLWFLYWIFFDVLVWNKPLVKVNWVNYVGAILSVAFIFTGFQLLKLKDKVDITRKNEQNNEQNIIQKQTTIEEQASIVKQNVATCKGLAIMEKSKHDRKGGKRKNKSAEPKSVSSKPDLCLYDFGYLRQISKVEEISGECMTCGRLLQCRYG